MKNVNIEDGFYNVPREKGAPITLEVKDNHVVSSMVEKDGEFYEYFAEEELMEEDNQIALRLLIHNCHNKNKEKQKEIEEDMEVGM